MLFQFVFLLLLAKLSIFSYAEDHLNFFFLNCMFIFYPLLFVEFCFRVLEIFPVLGLLFLHDLL